MALNGCGIWNERPIPMRQRRSGARCVMSVPANTTRPASGRAVPLAMPNSVVLPAPFGPMMPSASPSASAMSISCAMTTAPKRLEIFSKARIGDMFILAATSTLSSPRKGGPSIHRRRGYAVARSCHSETSGGTGPRRAGTTIGDLRQQRQLPAGGDLRRGLVGGDDEVELVALALPLAGDERRLGDVLHRLARPLHRPDNGLVVGGDNGIEDRFWL